MRIACVRIADFAVAALRRHDPTLAGAAVVVGGVPPERGFVQALSAEARGAGLRPGMTLTQAQAVLPAARFVRPDAELERRETAALLELLHGFSPGIEVAPRRGCGTASFFVDTRGLGRLHASEQAFGERLRAAVAERGYAASLGLAGSKFASEVAAREAGPTAGGCGDEGGVRLVAAGGERAFLAALSLGHLPFADDELDAVVGLGLRTIGAWAELPPETIGARFGTRGLALHALARGEDRETFLPTAAAEPLEVVEELEDGVDDLERLTFHLKRAVDGLCRKLAARGLATAALRLTLTLEDHSQASRETRFTRPTLAPRLLLDCLRLELSREELAAPVSGFCLQAPETAPARAEQLLLFARQNAAVDPQAVEAALARVRALIGPTGVVAAHPGDAHRPEAQVRFDPYCYQTGEAVAAAGKASRVGEPPPASPFCGLPTRLLGRPLPAEVRTRREHPAHLRSELVRGEVRASEGPHRVGGEWWGEGYERDYFVVTLGDGGRYWLFRDRLGGSWFLHGVFD